jgi:hypothetical protein
MPFILRVRSVFLIRQRGCLAVMYESCLNDAKDPLLRRIIQSLHLSFVLVTSSITSGK